MKINIVFITDENYLPQFCIALTSLLKNNQDVVDKIFLIHDLTNEKKILKVLEYFKKVYAVTILPLKMHNSSEFENFTTTYHATKAVYYRLALADILPNDIQRVLYLDSDLIVTGNLSKLADLYFSEQCIAYGVDHVHQPPEFVVEQGQRFGMVFKKYYNTGVLYLNLELMRKFGSTEKLLAIATKHNERLVYWDQDVLNIYFLNRWANLEFSYNAFDLTEKLNYLPKIVHYSGHQKPWKFPCTHPYKDLYWEYVKDTPFQWAIYIPYLITYSYTKPYLWFKSIIPLRLKNLLKRILRK